MKKNQNAKYIERFEQLIRVLRGLGRHERTKHFNMRNWGVDTECGTTMCAAGFCGSDTWFRRRGFRLELAGTTDGEGRPLRQLRYAGNVSWAAVQEFFGHQEDDGEDVFSFSTFSTQHPVFAKPNSVGEVIRAAKARIKLLKEQAA